MFSHIYLVYSMSRAILFSFISVHCVPGFYGNSGFCKPCDLGSYKSTSGIENCTKCKDNFTTNSIASTNDSDCSIGMYAHVRNSFKTADTFIT